MEPSSQIRDRRTSVDQVFDYLYDEIASLSLKPGDKISEADIAAQFGVSRQPVRDAFSRLDNLDLLLIRPQRATEVRRFSLNEVTKSRFVRASIEAEVLRRASALCTATDATLLDASLAQQAEAAETSDHDLFSRQDLDFHKLLCQIAKVDFAFDVIAAEKAKVDRLCTLSLGKADRIEKLVADHAAIAQALKDHDTDAAVAAGMLHLSRLDATIQAISIQNPDYFEP
jgi:DNA-binding GntR family transcriptional regulator